MDIQAIASALRPHPLKAFFVHEDGMVTCIDMEAENALKDLLRLVTIAKSKKSFTECDRKAEQEQSHG